MSPHHTMIEAGPGAIHRLCCGTKTVAADGITEELEAALGAIDDRVALVGDRPVAVDSLWRAALRSLVCVADDPASVTVVVHPSWWSPSRVGVVTAAAEGLPGDVLVRPRSWLLAQASHADAIVVEIAERLVAIVGAEVIGIPRKVESQIVADEVACAIGEIGCGTKAVVLIDAPSAVVGATTLGALIAGVVRDSGRSAIEIDAMRLSKLATSAQSTLSPRSEPPPPSVPRSAGIRWRAFGLRGLVAVAVVLAAVVPMVAAVGHHRVAPTAATTFLVEGRVALTVPADWSVQRVLAGPGSARVQVTSPSDPEMALHVTQSPVPPHETLSATAERLRRAIASEPDGVFVEFNPSGVAAGRPAVTYREVRASHQVRWTVVLDGPVRISVGCQSRPGADDAVREVCEQAVRSARAIG